MQHNITNFKCFRLILDEKHILRAYNLDFIFWKNLINHVDKFTELKVISFTAITPLVRKIVFLGRTGFTTVFATFPRQIYAIFATFPSISSFIQE